MLQKRFQASGGEYFGLKKKTDRSLFQALALPPEGAGGMQIPLVRSLEKRLKASLGAPQDQGVHIMRPFIGVHSLKVHHMADHLKLA